jgi:hypothetical protein
MPLQWNSIVIDCTDPLLVASVWSQALGLELHGPTDDDDLWLEPGGDCPDILFGQGPEVKSAKDRIRLDLRPGDEAAEAERLIALGSATDRHRPGGRDLGGHGRPGGQRVLRSTLTVERLT